jgi:serine protease
MTVKKSYKPLLVLAVVALFGGALIRSVAVRLDGDDDPDPAEMATGYDEPTGRVLIDLDDDADDDDREEVIRALREAIAPYSWPADETALGEVLDRDAELYRIDAPDSENDDILRVLADDDDIEAVELERYWTLPVGAEAFAFDDEEEEEDEGGVLEQPSDGPDVFRPNDPYYKHQWHLDQIQMPRAWLRSRGEGVVVAVIDTGVSFEDYSSGRRRWVRAPDLAETPFVAGYDFVDRDAHPNDEHGHGTHVSGTIAQSTNNGIGVAGVAPRASIMPLRVLDRNGRGSFGDVAAAIRWAADHGAHVINMSLGGGLPSQAVKRAIDYAHGKGVVVVAAAGNSSRSRVEYPAMHDHVIAVGAVRFDETLTFYSCYGKGLDVVAPGGDIRVDQNNDGVPDGVIQNTLVPGTTDRHDYLGYMGTSMAAPHVAGVVALIHANGVRDPDTIESILKRTAKAKSDKRRYASGLVQADAALQGARTTFGGMRGLAVLAFGLLAFAGLKKRGALAISRPWAIGLGAVGAGALASVPLTWMGELGGMLESATSGLAIATGEAGYALTPFVLSALLPFGLVSVLLHVRKLSSVLAAVVLAFGALLGVEAILPSVAPTFLPDVVMGPWLVLNAFACVFLARAVATRRKA